MLFVTLPIPDLASSRGFYEALGSSVDEHSSDERTAAVVIDDDVVDLLVRDSFLVAVGDPSAGPAVTERVA